MPSAASSTADGPFTPARSRVRLRPLLPFALGSPPKPTASVAAKGKDHQPSDVTALPSIAQLRIAFEETPTRLRELEEGWRARRRRMLGDITCEATQLPVAGGSQPNTKCGKISSETRRAAKTGRRELESLSLALPARRLERQPAAKASLAVDANSRVSPSPGPPFAPALKREPRPIIRTLPIIIAPPTPPASPPSPPRRTIPPYTVPTASSVIPGFKVAGGLPTILAHPLPPTSYPIPISRSTPRDTIHVQPLNSPYELIFSLDHGRRKVSVVRGGEEIALRDKVVSLRMQHLWDPKERKEWEMVAALVQRVKRGTPRVKIFHALGQLTITCSFPPDVILSFDLADPTDSSSLPKTIPKTKRTPMRDTTRRTKVRVTYSRLAKELVIDNASSTQNASAGVEKYRTRRVSPLSTTRTSGASTGDDAIFGLGVSRADGWREEEWEGVRRLRDLKDEWERYG